MGITVAEARRLGLLPSVDKKPSRKDRWFPYKSQVEYVFERGHGRTVGGWFYFRVIVVDTPDEWFLNRLDYEPKTFDIDGVSYTPDWRGTLCKRIGNKIQRTTSYIETKGSQHQRNWRATIQLLRQASVLYPEHRWYLAEWSSVPGTRHREWRFWSVINGRRKRIGGDSHVQRKARTREKGVF